MVKKAEHKLLSRDEFRNAVFERDGNRCVICGDTRALDAHHIIERRLFDNGGYYLSNGATLCDQAQYAEDGEKGCHYMAETTQISADAIRQAAGIEEVILPEDFYPDHQYDKWGNVILENGNRTKGPLFYDESVQKVLRQLPDFENTFTNYVKYPRTYHLPWSEGMTDDDKVLKDVSNFVGKRVIVTEKMDGENFTGYSDYCHARSVDGRGHYTRNWAKTFWFQRAWQFPDGWRMVAENLYAVHSIKYGNLPSYLMGISIWDDFNNCLSWDETLEWFDLLDMPYVPVLYDGIFDENVIKSLYKTSDREKSEGYVIRIADKFAYKDFRKSVAKFVRKNHITSNAHWFYGRTDHEVNELK